MGRIRWLDGAYGAMATSPTTLLAPLDRSLIRVDGPDRHDFLHRVCSQDVLGMGPGEGRPAALLTAKGKVAALFVLWKLPDTVLLEVERPHASGLLTQLDRYLFSEQVVLKDLGSQLHAVLAVGPGATALLAAAAPGLEPEPGRGGWRTTTPERFSGPAVALGTPGQVLHALPAEIAALLAGGQPQVDAAELERWRIAAGIPRLAVDTDASTLPPEANLDAAVSTTKGCYVGQEIVARIHTYGHVNRRLVRLGVATATVPAAGAPLWAEGEVVGRITSAVAVPAAGRVEALGYVPRVLATPGEVLTVGQDGPPAQVLALEAAP